MCISVVFVSQRHIPALKWNWLLHGLMWKKVSSIGEEYAIEHTNQTSIHIDTKDYMRDQIAYFHLRTRSSTFLSNRYSSSSSSSWILPNMLHCRFSDTFRYFQHPTHREATASAFAAAGRSGDRQDTASSGAGLEGLEGLQWPTVRGRWN